MTVIKGQRWVRIRSDVRPIGLGYRVQLYRVTDLHDRKMIGHRHISREAAARWIIEQGWRYIGPQYDV